MAEHTPVTWEVSKHGNLATKPKEWAYVEHNFPNAPYEGDLNDEYAIYPPDGESAPVALVAGKDNAHFITQACNNFEDLVKALEDCRSSVCGYAIRKSADYPEVVKSLYEEIQRIHEVACAALAKAKKPNP